MKWIRRPIPKYLRKQLVPMINYKHKLEWHRYPQFYLLRVGGEEIYKSNNILKKAHITVKPRCFSLLKI